MKTLNRSLGRMLMTAMVAGLLTVEASAARHAPTISWILAELRVRPLVYAYLLVATLGMMTILGCPVTRSPRWTTRRPWTRSPTRPTRSSRPARRRAAASWRPSR